MLFLLFPLEFPVEEASSSSSLRYDVLQEKRVYFCLLLVLSLCDETSRLIPTSVTMIDRKMVWSLFVVLLSLQWLCVLLSDFFFFLLHFFDTQVLLTKDIWSTTHTNAGDWRRKLQKDDEETHEWDYMRISSQMSFSLLLLHMTSVLSNSHGKWEDNSMDNGHSRDEERERERERGNERRNRWQISRMTEKKV